MEDCALVLTAGKGEVSAEDRKATYRVLEENLKQLVSGAAGRLGAVGLQGGMNVPSHMATACLECNGEGKLQANTLR
jgi:hypothetical protein